MAQEFKVLTAAAESGVYGVIINNSNKQQGYDTNNDNGSYINLTATNTDVQIPFTGGVTYGSDKLQFASLPGGLNTNKEYNMVIFSSGHTVLSSTTYSPNNSENINTIKRALGSNLL